MLDIQYIGKEGELLMLCERINANLDDYKKTFIEFTQFNDKIRNSKATSKDVIDFLKNNKKNLHLGDLGYLFFNMAYQEAIQCFALNEKMEKRNHLTLDEGIISSEKSFKDDQDTAYRTYTGFEEESLVPDEDNVQVYSRILRYALFYAEHLSGVAGKTKEYNKGLSDNIKEAID